MKHSETGKYWVKTSLKFSVLGVFAGLVFHLLFYDGGGRAPALVSMIIGFLIAFTLGIFEAWYTFSKLRRLAFIRTLLFKTLAYSLMIFIILHILMTMRLYFIEGVPLSERFSSDVVTRIFEPRKLLTTFIYSLLFSLFFNFIWQVSLLQGRRVLLNFFTGRYNKPNREERIFMFLDLTASTAITEKLGPEKYSAFIKEFIYDINNTALMTNAEIYQYTGDEVVLIWNLKEGVENNNCVKMFFTVEAIVNEKADYYMDKFGTIPGFKAGVHYGDVVITEIGFYKKDIAYHGDAINTAARIRSACSEQNKKLLVSESLKAILSETPHYRLTSIGSIALKGKEKPVELFDIEMNYTSTPVSSQLD